MLMRPSDPSSTCPRPPWLSSRPIAALFCLSSPSSLTTWDSCFSLALATSLPPFLVFPILHKVSYERTEGQSVISITDQPHSGVQAEPTRYRASVGSSRVQAQQGK